MAIMNKIKIIVACLAIILGVTAAVFAANFTARTTAKTDCPMQNQQIKTAKINNVFVENNGDGKTDCCNGAACCKKGAACCHGKTTAKL